MKKKRKSYVDKPEDVEMQKEIKGDADYTLALWGMAFVRNGSGRFVNLRADSNVRM